MDENIVKFLRSMVKKGKLTQAEADAKMAKHDKKENAKRTTRQTAKA